MKKIAVVTATRAEYGILKPLLEAIQREEDLELQLLVTGTHLSEKYGGTQEEILKDGIPIYRKIPIMEEGNTPYDISVTMANAICGFAAYFRDETPQLVIILGDRTEMLGVCCGAVNQGIPIAHLHGGEITQGAVDDSIRHAITKMSHLHFAVAEVYRKRIIQMGEMPDRVYNVGALSTENILKAPLLTYQELCREVGIPENRKYVVVTFHPVTLERGSESTQVKELLEAMESREEFFYLITKANADAGGETVNQIFEQFVRQTSHAKLVSSLGMIRYLSAVKYAEFVLGNSSSGILEAPVLGTPTVNIGERQKGRLMAESIVQCEPVCKEIISAMDAVKAMEHRASLLFGDGNTSKRIVKIIKCYLSDGKTDLKKKFYDFK